MKKLLLGLIALTLIGCQDTTQGSGSEEHPTVVIEEIQSETAKYIEDFEYLSKMLYETYPYFGVIQRQDIDINKKIKDYRKKVACLDNIDDFYQAMIDFTNEFQGNGHFNVITKEYYDYFLDAYDDPHSPYHKALVSPSTQSFYDKGPDQSSKTEKKANVTILEYSDTSTAYIGIQSFDKAFIENDRKTLSDFYSNLNNYEHLIIDLRNNSGGSTSYAVENIIKPLATQDYSYTQHILFNDNDYSRPFLEYAHKDDMQTTTPLSDFDLAQFPNLEVDDMNKLSHIMSVKNVYLADGSGYHGKIYVLVSPMVYSSSEAFVDFCKSSGFATIIGQPTGGDGIGFDPIIVSLPNSGIALKYSMHYGINSEGRNSEEFGTTPDILLDDHENAYEYIMKKIKAGS